MLPCPLTLNPETLPPTPKQNPAGVIGTKPLRRAPTRTAVTCQLVSWAWVGYEGIGVLLPWLFTHRHSCDVSVGVMGMSGCGQLHVSHVYV